MVYLEVQQERLSDVSERKHERIDDDGVIRVMPWRVKGQSKFRTGVVVKLRLVVVIFRLLFPAPSFALASKPLQATVAVPFL